MKRELIAAAFLAATSTIALAQAEKADPGSLSGKAKEQPSAGAGSTAAPTAKPKDGSLSDKASKDQPGSTGASSGSSGTSNETKKVPGSNATSEEQSKGEPGQEDSPPNKALEKD